MRKLRDQKYFRLLDRTLPSMGMGTWRLGSRGDSPITVLQAGLDRGLSIIDTAASYGVGHSESLVGEAIKGYRREDLFIITKVKQIKKTRAQVLESARKSAGRLGTYIDLLMLHTPPFDGKNTGERLRGLEDAVRKGYARNIGVSNFSLPRLQEAQSLCNLEIAAIENRLNLSDQLWLHDVVPYAEKSGMMYLAHIPLDTSRIRAHTVLSNVAAKYGKSGLQAALNWLLCLGPVVPIPKAGKPEHLIENMGALDWRLSPEDWTRLAEAKYPNGGVNKRILQENLRYYLTPDLFQIHCRHYLDPRNLSDYIRHTVYAVRNRI